MTKICAYLRFFIVKSYHVQARALPILDKIGLPGLPAPATAGHRAVHRLSGQLPVVPGKLLDGVVSLGLTEVLGKGLGVPVGLDPIQAVLSSLMKCREEISYFGGLCGSMNNSHLINIKRHVGSTMSYNDPHNNDVHFLDCVPKARPHSYTQS